MGKRFVRNLREEGIPFLAGGVSGKPLLVVIIDAGNKKGFMASRDYYQTDFHSPAELKSGVFAREWDDCGHPLSWPVAAQAGNTRDVRCLHMSDNDAGKVLGVRLLTAPGEPPASPPSRHCAAGPRIAPHRLPRPAEQPSGESPDGGEDSQDCRAGGLSRQRRCPGAGDPALDDYRAGGDHGRRSVYQRSLQRN